MNHSKEEVNVGFFIMVMLGIAGFGGWVANIVIVCNSPFDPITGLEIARVVGIFFAPLGAFLGYV